MKKTATKQGTRRSLGISAFPIIILCFILAMVIYHFVYGNPANFINNDPNNHPIQGNLLGTIYKGGIIVPVIQTLLFTVLTLSVERLIALKRAKGKKNLQQFVTKVKGDLEEGNIEAVRQACDEQKGTVANVIKSSLSTYSQVSACDTLSKEEKQLAVRKDLEEATMLELPTMEQNLGVIATITTLGTLMGLLGTVIGMIKSFAALSSAGGTDSIALSTGISEADDKAAKDLIIPITVPSNPIKVPKVVIVAITPRFCSIVGNSSMVASSRSFRTANCFSSFDSVSHDDTCE